VRVLQLRASRREAEAEAEAQRAWLGEGGLAPPPPLGGRWAGEGAAPAPVRGGWGGAGPPSGRTLLDADGPAGGGGAQGSTSVSVYRALGKVSVRVQPR
jgi:hypothetical protein